MVTRTSPLFETFARLINCNVNAVRARDLRGRPKIREMDRGVDDEVTQRERRSVVYTVVDVEKLGESGHLFAVCGNPRS